MVPIRSQFRTHTVHCCQGGKEPNLWLLQHEAAGHTASTGRKQRYDYWLPCPRSALEPAYSGWDCSAQLNLSGNILTDTPRAESPGRLRSCQIEYHQLSLWIQLIQSWTFNPLEP